MFKLRYYLNVVFYSVFLFCFSSINAPKTLAALTSEHVLRAREFVNETTALLMAKNKTNRQKRQAVIDKYISNINFTWIAKSSLGRSYSQLSQEEKKIYVNEFTKFFIYSWLPKLSIDEKTNLKVDVLDKSKKINDTDENITIVVDIGDGQKYEITLRTRITHENKFQVLNLYFEEIDLVTSYQAHFLSYIEEHKNDPRSIIGYLQEQNKEKVKSIDFKIKSLPEIDLKK